MAKVAGILGKKVGMTQLFDSKGEVRPATVLQAGPCVVTQSKTASRDGYESAQLGFVEFVKESRVTKPMRGHFAKHNLPPVKFLREVPIEVEEKSGDRRRRESGRPRHGRHLRRRELRRRDRNQQGARLRGCGAAPSFAGGPKSHGSMFQITGSIGSSAFPSRVFKGMRMSGHMGMDRVTMRNLRILGVDKDENLLVVEGSVPGPNGG